MLPLGGINVLFMFSHHVSARCHNCIRLYSCNMQQQTYCLQNYHWFLMLRLNAFKGEKNVFAFRQQLDSLQYNIIEPQTVTAGGYRDLSENWVHTECGLPGQRCLNSQNPLQTCWIKTQTAAAINKPDRARFKKKWMFCSDWTIKPVASTLC